MSGQTYIFAAGGTGGHLFPAIAVAERLVERDPTARVLFVGSDRPIEREILSSTRFEHHMLPTASLAGVRRHPLRSAWRLGTAYRAAVQLMHHKRPVAVIGGGGLTSAAPLLAARRTGAPILLLEQNVIPGRATRWLSRLGGTVCVTYAETASLLPRSARAVVTGNPVRRRMTELIGHHEPSGDCRTLLVLGGSQGARPINDLMLGTVTARRSLLDGWRVIHQTGPADQERVRAAYASHEIKSRVSAFFTDTSDLYRQAEVVVSRAGGTTLSELACAGLPAVLLPYPQAADNHQWHNAEVFQAAGAAIRFEDSACDAAAATRFAEVLASLLQDADRRAAMSAAMSTLARPTAAIEVMTLLDRVCQRV
ncbi:MAG: glycosyltransferase [Planctomycetaceae bacterium]